jgi:hypothetical protein
MTPEQTETQLRVGEFPEAERAIELAELIAAEMSLEEGRSGWSIEVRCPLGLRLYSAPVGTCASYLQQKTELAAS